MATMSEIFAEKKAKAEAMGGPEKLAKRKVG